ncbi:MAG: hypothetical protein VW683_04060 [Betaproteobacteria bacterium]
MTKHFIELDGRTYRYVIFQDRIFSISYEREMTDRYGKSRQWVEVKKNPNAWSDKVTTQWKKAEEKILAAI